MEHIDLIIQASANRKFEDLAYQAKDDVRGFKHIMSLAILADLLQWTEELDLEENRRFLKLRIEKLISECSECFVIPDSVRFGHGVYTDVNLPGRAVDIQWIVENQSLDGIINEESPENPTETNYIIFGGIKDY